MGGGGGGVGGRARNLNGTSLCSFPDMLQIIREIFRVACIAGGFFWLGS